MPKQAPFIRKRNFNEVALGYTNDMAVAEAKRCLGCKKPLCVEGCPVEIEGERSGEIEVAMVVVGAGGAEDEGSSVHGP